jgi:DUF4097 and DUF4098 domain-containing protein YvlB
MRATWVLAVAITAAAGLSANTIGIPGSEFRQAYALQPNGRVIVQNLYGDVAITAWDRNEVLVEAFKKSADPRRLDDARIVVDSSSEVLSIRTQYAGADVGQPASVNYRIMVPRTANLENVKLINGGLMISGMTGPVKASSVNGSIRAERLRGETDLSTVNGQLDAGFETVGGGKTITLSSVNGPIRVWLPWNATASVDADNRSGGIESEFGHPWRGANGHRLRTNVNRGGTPVHVHNVNGGITIRATWRS